MKAKRILITVLAAFLAFSGSGIAFARGAGGSGRNSGGVTGRELGMQERVEKKGAEGLEHGKHKGESKNHTAKGSTERATPATRAVPTPGTPGATPAIPATPSKK